MLPLVPARSSTGMDRGVDSKLRFAPRWNSYDFDAAVIEAFGVDVEVAHENIAGNGSPRLRGKHL